MREVIEQSKIPRRTLYTGAGMPAIGIGTFGSDKYGEAEVAEAVYRLHQSRPRHHRSAEQKLTARRRMCTGRTTSIRV